MAAVLLAGCGATEPAPTGSAAARPAVSTPLAPATTSQSLTGLAEQEPAPATSTATATPAAPETSLPADISEATEESAEVPTPGVEDTTGFETLPLPGDGVAPEPIPLDVGVDLSSAAVEVPCHWDLGQSRAFKCFAVTVPVDWSLPAGPQTEVVAAVRVGGDPAQPALAVLAGEPGESILPIGRHQNVKAYRQLFIAQRGASWRDTQYACPAGGVWLGGVLAADTATAALIRDDLNADCAQALRDDSGVAAAGTSGYARDIAAVVAALGIDRWVVHGRGYSAAVVGLLLSDPPAGLAGGILDGPRSPRWDPDSSPPQAAAAALEHLDALCEADQDCRAMLDPSGMRLAELALHLIDVYDTSPLIVEDPNGGEVDVIVDGGRLASAVVWMLEDPARAAALPGLLAAAENQEPSAAPTLARVAVEAADDDVAAAAYWLTVCSQRPARAAERSVTGFAAAVQGRGLDTDCIPWASLTVAAPTPPAGAAQVPVLVLAGGLDPYSRPGDAKQAAAAAGDARLVVFSWMSHGTWGKWDNCVETVVEQFMASPGGDAHDACADRAARLSWVRS